MTLTIPILAALFAIGSLVLGGLLWLIYSAHGKDSTAHQELFRSFEKELQYLKNSHDNHKQELADRIASHSRDSDAHSRADQRIRTLESDFSYVKDGINEVKAMLQELLKQGKGI